MSFFLIRSNIDERLVADPKTTLLRVHNRFHHFLTDGPVVVTIPRKRKHLDFLWVYKAEPDYGSYYLVSPRFWQLLSENNATGFELRPTDTRLQFEHSASDRDYRQLVITGWGGIAKGIEPVASPRGSHCFSLPVDTANLVDLSQWDGSDIFRVWPVGMFVTERIAALVSAHRIKGLHLENLKTVSFRGVDVKVGFIGSPLCLTFPEERAREIGIPLGIYNWDESSPAPMSSSMRVRDVE